jgi:DHA1 family quinolone resistance protein-like MFS transporter
MKLPFSFTLDVSIGKVVTYFVLSDLVLLSGWGLITPIFSVFIIQSVAGATLTTVGIAASIYWITKSLIQLPIAYYLDRTTGERDDFYVLLAGLMLVGLTAFSFILVHEIWQLYLAQFFHAIGFGMYVPSWTGIFSRHVNREHSSFAWSLDSTTISFASGVTGAIGGALAQAFGFPIVFFLGGLFSLSAAFLVLAVPDLIFPRKTSVETPVMLRDHTPRSTPR